MPAGPRGVVPSLKNFVDPRRRRSTEIPLSLLPSLPPAVSESHIEEHQLVRVPDSPDKASGVPADAVIFPLSPFQSRSRTSTSKSLPPGSNRDVPIRGSAATRPLPGAVKTRIYRFRRVAIAKIVGDGRHLSLSLSPSPTIDPRRRINKSRAAFCRATFGEGWRFSLAFSVSLARARWIAARSIEIQDVTCVRARTPARTCVCVHAGARSTAACTRETCVGGRAGRQARTRARGCARYKRRPCPTGYTLWRMTFEKVNRRRKTMCYSRLSVGGPAAPTRSPSPPSCARAPAIIWFCTATLLCVQCEKKEKRGKRGKRERDREKEGTRRTMEKTQRGKRGGKRRSERAGGWGKVRKKDTPREYMPSAWSKAQFSWRHRRSGMRERISVIFHARRSTCDESVDATAATATQHYISLRNARHRRVGAAARASTNTERDSREPPRLPTSIHPLPLVKWRTLTSPIVYLEAAAWHWAAGRPIATSRKSHRPSAARRVSTARDSRSPPKPLRSSARVELMRRLAQPAELLSAKCLFRSPLPR